MRRLSEMSFFSGHQCCAQRRGGKSLICRRSEVTRTRAVPCLPMGLSSSCPRELSSPSPAKLSTCITSSWKCSFCSTPFFLVHAEVITSTHYHEICFYFSCCAYQSCLIIHDCTGWPPTQNRAGISPGAGAVPHTPGGGSEAPGSMHGAARAL